ncbi:transposase-like protein, partial [Pyrenophora tritici-repentis]
MSENIIFKDMTEGHTSKFNPYAPTETRTCWDDIKLVFVLTILDIAVPLSLGLSIPGPETLARFYNICLQPTTAIDD